MKTFEEREAEWEARKKLVLGNGFQLSDILTRARELNITLTMGEAEHITASIRRGTNIHGPNKSVMDRYLSKFKDVSHE